MIMQLEAKYVLFDSSEEMLAPETLSAVLKSHVSQVTCHSFDSADGYSGSQMFSVTADDRRLVMKRLLPALDWQAIATNDHQCRSTRVWQYGLLDRVQAHIDHAILAGCRDGDHYAILMNDVSDGLFYGKEFTPKTIHRLLDALAAMHAIFWEEDELRQPELGLCNAEALVKTSWPIHFDRFRHASTTVEYLTKGWGALFELVEPDVRDALLGLMEQPQPIFDRLAQFPSTFVHADYRPGNLALLPETNRVVALDWQLAGYAPATICLSWYIMCGEVFTVQDAAAEYYRRQLATHLGKRLDSSLWQPMLDVGCLVDVLRKGCWHALFATTHNDEAVRGAMRQSITSYDAIVRRGLKWL